MADLYWANVALMLGFDSATNGSQAVTDESPTPKTVTWSGASTLVDNAQTVFSSTEALKLATADGFISVANAAAFSVANTNEKTYEAWIYITANSTRIQSIFDKRHASSGSEFSFGVQTTGKLFFQTLVSGSADVNINGTTAVTINTWHHVAACRHYDGTHYVWSIYLDGNQEATGNQTSTPTSNTDPLAMGHTLFNTGRYLTGWMDEIRVTDGVARYTTGFTAPTAKFPRGGGGGSPGGSVCNSIILN